jgi:hypothetical protein
MTDATHGATDDQPASAWLLRAAGIAYLGLGAVLGAAYVAGVQASLFPTGWILPVVLLATGGLMALRRRFDIVATLWGGLTLAVFVLDLTLYMDSLALGVEQPSAFDATIVVAVLGLVPLVLRPRFRS